jgi:hypothetical protein
MPKGHDGRERTRERKHTNTIPRPKTQESESRIHKKKRRKRKKCERKEKRRRSDRPHKNERTSETIPFIPPPTFYEIEPCHVVEPLNVTEDTLGKISKSEIQRYFLLTLYRTKILIGTKVEMILTFIPKMLFMNLLRFMMNILIQNPNIQIYLIPMNPAMMIQVLLKKMKNMNTPTALNVLNMGKITRNLPV